VETAAKRFFIRRAMGGIPAPSVISTRTGLFSGGMKGGVQDLEGIVTVRGGSVNSF
jgi:hypothetical protein